MAGCASWAPWPSVQLSRSVIEDCGPLRRLREPVPQLRHHEAHQYGHHHASSPCCPRIGASVAAGSSVVKGQARVRVGANEPCPWQRVISAAFRCHFVSRDGLNYSRVTSYICARLEIAITAFSAAPKRPVSFVMAVMAAKASGGPRRRCGGRTRAERRAIQAWWGRHQVSVSVRRRYSKSTGLGSCQRR